MIEPHYTVQQLAELVAVHPETIRREASKGDLRCKLWPELSELLLKPIRLTLALAPVSSVLSDRELRYAFGAHRNGPQIGRDLRFSESAVKEWLQSKEDAA